MHQSVKAVSRLLVNGPSWELPFLYGTAWKAARTKELVTTAVNKGFRKIDTAAQPRHYQEALVGEALRDLFKDGVVTREEIYLQTKFTTPAGQDPENIPYDASAPLATQIHTSVASSLHNLRPRNDPGEDTYIDCLLLHSPLPTIEQTLQAWKLLESYVPHKTKALGISNTSIEVLQTIHEASTIKPSVVQNRFYPQTHYDGSLRSFCNQHGITYQSFWTLTGNPHLLQSEFISKIANTVGVSASVVLYALVMDQGIEVLNGTTSTEHMETDLDGIVRVREWAKAHEHEWSRIGDAFKNCIDGRDH